MRRPTEAVLGVAVVVLVLAGCDGDGGGDAPPTITSHPSDQTVTEGQTATFSVTATGSGTLTYQWYRGGVAITGAQIALYTTPATTLADDGALFTCVVTNAGGSVTSNAATLTVNMAPPQITSHPSDLTVTEGQTATFTVTATGSGTLLYQWKKNGVNVTGGTGGTTASYTTPATVLADSGAQFTCVVSNSVGSVTSNAATLTVNPPHPRFFDFNADGFGDVIVGALLDSDGGTGSGCAFVFFGSASPPAVIDASVADVKLVGGDADDYFGYSVSSGDVNADGFGDVIVGAHGDDDGGSYSGCAFVFFGSASPPAVIDASAADVKLVGGDAYDSFGLSVSSGDVNADGFGDVIVGACYDNDGGSQSGCAFVFFGGASPPAVIDASAADVKLVGGDAYDYFGYSVSSGDVNADGFGDVIVGAHYDDDGGIDSGCAFVFFGSASPPAVIDASAADVKLVGGDAGDRFGYSVSSGDVNADGFGDVIVGAYCDDDGGSYSGCAFVFFGSASPPAVIDTSAADVKLVGGDAGDWFGCKVSSGDVNADGFGDVIVGAIYDDDGGIDSGCAFVFFGSASPPAVIDASAADVKLVGGDAGDIFGLSVSSGDVNADGFGDVIVGAYYDDDGGTDSGCAFVFLGSASQPAVIDASAADVKLVGGDAGDEFGYSVSGGGR